MIIIACEILTLNYFRYALKVHVFQDLSAALAGRQAESLAATEDQVPA